MVGNTSEAALSPAQQTATGLVSTSFRQRGTTSGEDKITKVTTGARPFGKPYFTDITDNYSGVIHINIFYLFISLIVIGRAPVWNAGRRVSPLVVRKHQRFVFARLRNAHTHEEEERQT
jgi:hypothetical protein